MRRQILLLIAFGTLAATAAARPAVAAEYGAVAYGEESGRRGVAWGWDTQKDAEKAAMKDCGDGCKIVVRFGPKMCVAIATPEKGKGIGISSRPNETDAKNAALADCKKRNPEGCVVQDSRCNR